MVESQLGGCGILWRAVRHWRCGIDRSSRGISLLCSTQCVRVYMSFSTTSAGTQLPVDIHRPSDRFEMGTASRRCFDEGYLLV